MDGPYGQKADRGQVQSSISSREVCGREAGVSTSNRSSMLSINMRVFKTVLLIVFFGASVRCLPVADKPNESKIEADTGSKTEVSSVVPQEIDVTTAAPTSTYSEITDYYDQRQNGTENYRIHVDGLVFVFAPADALLLAAAAGTSEPNAPTSNQGASPTRPVGELDKPAADGAHNKPGDLVISKTIQK